MTLPLSLQGEVRTLNGAQRSLAFVGEGEDTIRLASNTLTPALSLKGEGEGSGIDFCPSRIMADSHKFEEPITHVIANP